MSELPTVIIRNDLSDCGYCIINKSDFDPKKHELYEAEKQKAAQGKKGK